MDREQKTYDGMTNLPDRMTFFADVKGFGSKLKEGERLPIVLIQLTRLINVNRKYGVKAGDRLLMEIARHLEEKYPGYEAYRIANSRFVLLGPGVDGQGVEELVESLHQRFKQTWPVVQEKETCDIPVKALLVQFYGEPQDTENDLLDKMNYAISVIADKGKDGVIFFDGEIQAAMEHKQYVMEEMRYAMEHRTFQMYYQPIYDCARKEFVSAESLIRLFGRDGKFISPGEFIPMAEEYGLIDGISWIVLEKVCEFLGANPALPLKTVSVNMTGQQILDPIFIRRIEQNLEKYRVKGERLRIEITERTVTDDFAEVKKVMESLAQKGIRFYLDDFGTGYSNLSSMLSLPFEVIKFDQSLVRAMDESEKALKTIGLLADIMHENDFYIVAEGIETEGQAKAASEKKLDRIQGFYYAKPLSGEELIAFLAGFQGEK